MNDAAHLAELRAHIATLDAMLNARFDQLAAQNVGPATELVAATLADPQCQALSAAGLLMRTQAAEVESFIRRPAAQPDTGFADYLRSAA